jgi:hypothetical protein
MNREVLVEQEAHERRRADLGATFVQAEMADSWAIKPSTLEDLMVE